MLNQRQVRKQKPVAVSRTWSNKQEVIDEVDRRVFDQFRTTDSRVDTLFDPRGSSPILIELQRALAPTRSAGVITMHTRHAEVLDYLLANNFSITLDRDSYAKNEKLLEFMALRGWIDLPGGGVVKVAPRLVRLMVNYKPPAPADQGKVWRFANLTIIVDDSVPVIFHVPSGRQVEFKTA